MPLDRPALTLEDVRRMARAAFAPGEAQLWGLEAETVVERAHHPCGRPRLGELPARDDLPAGGKVSVEPGGQLEISTRPHLRPDEALDALAADEAALAVRLAEAGLRPRSCAVDTDRPPSRILDLPRYRAMEAFFDARGPHGRRMMCNTASLQVNVSNHGRDPAQRWRLLHSLAPVLVATFANSPGRDDDGTRWASLRQRIWARIDPGRTAPPDLYGDPVESWMRYALAADVMLIRIGDGAIDVAPGMPFGAWLRDGHPAGWPSVADLAYHVTTLFPPIRPRGWLELRMLDALPREVREVAVLVIAAALEEPVAGELTARMPCTAGWWTAAAQYGLGHPGLAGAADLLFELIAVAPPSVTDRDDRIERVLRYRESHVRRRRHPRAGGRSAGRAGPRVLTRIG